MNKILRKHNLRKIVETTNESTTPNWSKDALALYLIRESCGSNRFSLIEKISKAEEAWDTCAFNSGIYFSPKDTHALSFYNNSLKFANR